MKEQLITGLPKSYNFNEVLSISFTNTGIQESNNITKAPMLHNLLQIHHVSLRLQCVTNPLHITVSNRLVLDLAKIPPDRVTENSPVHKNFVRAGQPM